MVDNLFILANVFPKHMLASLTVNEILLLRCVSWSTNIIGLLFNVEMSPSCFKYMNYVLSEST